jgi:hypothetical protein
MVMTVTAITSAESAPQICFRSLPKRSTKRGSTSPARTAEPRSHGVRFRAVGAPFNRCTKRCLVGAETSTTGVEKPAGPGAQASRSWRCVQTGLPVAHTHRSYTSFGSLVPPVGETRSAMLLYGCQLVRDGFHTVVQDDPAARYGV